MTFEAKYGGWCADCDDRIQVGDEINYTDDVGTLVHTECARATDREPDVCAQCWLTKPCDCEDL